MPNDLPEFLPLAMIASESDIDQLTVEHLQWLLISDPEDISKKLDQNLLAVEVMREWKKHYGKSNLTNYFHRFSLILSIIYNNPNKVSLYILTECF